MKFHKIVFCFVAHYWTFVIATYKLQEHFEWNILDYEYSSDRTKAQALKTGRFIPENNLPVGVEIWGDKLFVTVPRWRQG